MTQCFGLYIDVDKYTSFMADGDRPVLESPVSWMTKSCCFGRARGARARLQSRFS